MKGNYCFTRRWLYRRHVHIIVSRSGEGDLVMTFCCRWYKSLLFNYEVSMKPRSFVLICGTLFLMVLVGSLLWVVLLLFIFVVWAIVLEEGLDTTWVMLSLLCFKRLSLVLPVLSRLLFDLILWYYSLSLDIDLTTWTPLYPSYVIVSYYTLPPSDTKNPTR